jgi:hypothetical protein
MGLLSFPVFSGFHHAGCVHQEPCTTRLCAVCATIMCSSPPQLYGSSRPLSSAPSFHADQRVGTGTSVTTRVQQLDVGCETKTKDNVFVQMVVSVQYSPIGTDQSFYDAYYKLTAPEAQMRAYVEDIVRSSVPKLILDDVFLVRLKERGKKYACGRTVACSMV